MSLKNHQYDAIMRQYNRKQLYHKHLLDEHIRLAYAKLPQLSQLDAQEADASYACAEKLIAGDDSAGKQLETTLAQIQQTRTDLLLRGGFPEDYLTLTYSCPLCKDTGFVSEREKCVCFYKAATELLYNESNHREQYEKENFDTFSLEYYNEETVDANTGASSLTLAQNALHTARAYVDSFSRTPGNLLIYGPTGVGKTFLSNCIAKELIEDIYSVVHLSASALFERLADHQFHQEEDEALYDTIYDCDLLIIDDLGTEVSNSFVINSFCQCVDTRLKDKKGTIITTNLELADLQSQYLDRTFSRLISGYTFLRMAGDDIRFQKKKHQKENH